MKKYNKLEHLNIQWQYLNKKLECGEKCFATVTIYNSQRQWTITPKRVFLSRGDSGFYIIGFSAEYRHPVYSQYCIAFTQDENQGTWSIAETQELQVPCAYVFDFAEVFDAVHPSMRTLLQSDTNIIAIVNSKLENTYSQCYHFQIPNAFVIVNEIKYENISATLGGLHASNSDKVTISIDYDTMICSLNARNIPYHVAKKYAKNTPALVPHNLLGVGEYSMQDIPFALAEDEPHPYTVEASSVFVSCITDRFLIMGTYYTFPIPLLVSVYGSMGWNLSHKFELQDKSCTIAQYSQIQYQGDPEETPYVEKSCTPCDIPFTQLLAKFSCTIINLPSTILHSQVESIHLHMGDPKYPKEYFFFHVRAQDGTKYQLAFDSLCSSCSIYETDKGNSTWLVLKVCDNDPIRSIQNKMLHHAKPYCDVRFE